MCGIAGIIDLTGKRRVQPVDLTRMLSAMRYRGPDESGLYLDDRASLAHLRLSIIDLSGGIQPIHNEDETLWITYNGEVYNYRELREDLLKRGHTFRTQTDTEVILHLYEEKGADALADLNGQFAFAIWDARKHELFAARDRVGVRPLHYTTVNDRFIFASEIKAILAVPEVPRRVDPLAMDQIFTFWTTLPGRTFFDGIHELPPGHCLLFNERGLRTQRYWAAPFREREDRLTGDPRAIAEEVGSLLTDAVRLRLRADVTVGTYLSGGLDSSGISAIVARRFSADVKTFGIRFEDGRFDEGEHQRAMVGHLGVDHRELVATDAAISEAFAAAAWHCEKPILRTAPVPLYLLSRLVQSQGIKVVLTGEGADEFSGGYDIFKEALVRQFWARNPASKWRGRLIERLYPDIFRDDRTRKTVAGFFLVDPETRNDPLFSHLIRWGTTARLKTFFSDGLRAEIGAYDACAEVRAGLPAGFDRWHTLHKAQFLESTIFLSTYLLSSQGDRMAMAHSVEVRLPFLDHRFVELMGRIPPWMKMCGLDEKHILKKALAPLLPASIVNRTKHPYRAPIHRCLIALAGSETGRAALTDEAIAAAGLFNAARVGMLMKKLTAADRASETDAMALAGILSAQIVYRRLIADPELGTAPVVRPELVVDKRTSDREKYA
jgi:asparagine synthase (glutamine-hydrolysing)